MNDSRKYTYENMANILAEKSISKMVRRGEYGEEGDQAQTAQAKYKADSSLERAEDTAKRADSKESKKRNMLTATHAEEKRAKKGPPSKRAERALKKHPKAAKKLRVPAPLKGDEDTHKTAAVISKRAKKVNASTIHTYKNLANVLVEKAWTTGFQDPDYTPPKTKPTGTTKKELDAATEGIPKKVKDEAKAKVAKEEAARKKKG